MALISVIPGRFFGGRKGVEISGFQLDATLQETHTSTLSPTEHAVEDGSLITDHAEQKPHEVTIEGIVSDTPLNLGASLQGAGTIAGTVIGNKIGSSLGKAVLPAAGGALVGLLLNRSGSASKNAFDHFRDLQAKRIPFDIVTGLIEYKNMMLTSLTVTRDPSTGKSLRFSATCRQVNIVTNQTIKIPNSVAKTIAEKKAKLEKKQAQDATPDNRTLAKQLFQSAKGGLGL